MTIAEHFSNSNCSIFTRSVVFFPMFPFIKY